jgi:outer membrane protein, heavy metal efflux system
MKQKIFWLIVMAAAPAVGQPVTNELTLSAVIAEVLAKHPALKASRAEAEAKQARARQEGAWADPRVGVDVERSDTTRFFTYTDNEWMVAQELPLSGKNRRRAKAASAEAEAALAETERRRLNLARDAAVAFHNLANAHTQLELNSRNAALLQQFVEISRIKHEAGARMQADVIMAESEMLKNQEVRRDLEQKLAEGQFRLNVLMGRHPSSPLGKAVPSELVPPPFEADALEGYALQHRPELRAASQRIAAARARQDLAKRAWIPDPELRVEARQFNGSGARIQEYDTGIFFNFPWFNRGKYRAGIEEAKKSRESAEYDLGALENETRGLVREHLKRIETLHHHYVLFRDKVAPLSRQSIEATRIGYSNDKATFLELITAQRTLQEVEAMTQQHLTDYLIALAEFQAMTGVGNDEIRNPTSEGN